MWVFQQFRDQTIHGTSEADVDRDQSQWKYELLATRSSSDVKNRMIEIEVERAIHEVLPLQLKEASKVNAGDLSLSQLRKLEVGCEARRNGFLLCSTQIHHRRQQLFFQFFVFQRI